MLKDIPFWKQSRSQKQRRNQVELRISTGNSWNLMNTLTSKINMEIFQG